MSTETPGPPAGGLGDLLRQARERSGLDLSAISARTHVRRAYLEALEAEDLDALPEDVYARNFLRLFARAVDVDEDDALARFGALRDRRAGRASGVFRSGVAAPPDGTASARPSAGHEARRDGPRRAAEGRPAAPPRRGVPASGALRQVAPLLMTLVLAGVLVGTAVWGFNRLLFRPQAPAAGPSAPATTADAGGAGSDVAPADPDGPAAPATGLAAPALPGGDALPDEILLTVTSEPSGAEVTVDAFPLPGTTPIEAVPVTARPERTLRVERDGYVPFEGTFDMTTDRSLQVALEPLPTAADAPAAAPGDGVVVEVREATWLEAYQSTARGEGERLAYTTAQPGERFAFARPVYLHLGNAGGVDVTVDGEPVGPLGSSGAVTGRAFPAP